jgi:hypothetical protein
MAPIHRFLRPRWLRLAVVALACASAVHGRLGDGGARAAPQDVQVANASMADEPVVAVMPQETQGDVQEANATSGDEPMVLIVPEGVQEANSTSGDEPMVLIVPEGVEAPPVAPTASNSSTRTPSPTPTPTAAPVSLSNSTGGNETAPAPLGPPVVVPLPVDAVSHDTPPPAAAQVAPPTAPQEAQPAQAAPPLASSASGTEAHQILIIGGAVLGVVVLLAAAVVAGLRRRHRLPELETQPAPQTQEPPSKRTFWGSSPKPEANDPVFALSFHDPDVWSGQNDSFYPPPDDLVRAKRGDKDLKIVATNSPRAVTTFRKDGSSPRAVPAPPSGGSPRAAPPGKPPSPTGRALPPMPPRPGSPEALSAWKDKHNGAIKLAEKMFLGDKFDSVRVRTGSGTLVEGEI